MISIENLNKHAYPKTRFYLNKDNELLLDLNIRQKGIRISPVNMGTLDNIVKGRFEPNPTLTDFKQTESLYNFLAKTLDENIQKIDNRLEEYKRQFPNAAAFKENLPPEVKVLSENQDNEQMVIVSDNKLINQNVNKLNKYLFSIIEDIAMGKDSKSKRTNSEEIVKILNSKKMSQKHLVKENQDYLGRQSKILAKEFNSHLDKVANNENFMNFIRDNKDSFSFIINTRGKDRSKLIELANEKLGGKEDLEKRCKDARIIFGKYTGEVAKNILSIAINKIKEEEKNRQLSEIVQGLLNKKTK